jgi:hypothetical protein
MSNMMKFHELLSASSENQEPCLGALKVFAKILRRKARCFTALAFGASVAMGIHCRCKAQA